MAGATNPLATVWFYNSDTGSVISEPALGDTIQSHLPGWHGPFGTKQEALDYYTANAAANPGWKAPTGLAGNLGNEASAATGLTLAGLHLAWPGADTFLARALKIVVGGVLLIAGILKMTGTDKAALGVAGAAAGKLPGV
jgi:hypothetical protein